MTETNKDESKWDSGEVEPVKEKDISSEDPGQKSKIRKKIHKSRPDENP